MNFSKLKKEIRERTGLNVIPKLSTEAELRDKTGHLGSIWLKNDHSEIIYWSNGDTFNSDQLKKITLALQIANSWRSDCKNVGTEPTFKDN